MPAGDLAEQGDGRHDMPSFEEVVEKHDLAILKTQSAADMQKGDITNVGGSITFASGTPSERGIYHLVQRWRFQTPMLRLMCETAERETRALHAYAASFSDLHVEAGAQPDWIAYLREPGPRQRMSDFMFGQIAAEATASATAGAVMAVISTAVAMFEKDIGATYEHRRKAGPFFGGRSFGSAVKASSANFRHHEDWFREHGETPPPGQRKRDDKWGTIEVLADILPHSVSKHADFGKSVSHEVLAVISNGNGYEGLGRSLFEFATNLVEVLDGKSRADGP